MNIFHKTLLTGIIILLSACGASPKTNFYILSAKHDNEIITHKKMAIGVWKVYLPELIDRPEIVTRTGTHTIKLADFHRWAGGLSSNISLLIASELSHNLKTGHVDVYPWSTYRNFDFQVKVHIWEFYGELNGKSKINGAFVILNGKGNKKIQEEVFSFEEKVKNENYSEMAAAMSRLVVSLSDKISQAISAQHSKK